MLPQVRSWRSGDIDLENAGPFLALAIVICIGGSWVAPADAVKAGHSGRITELARVPAGLGRLS